MNDIQKLKKEIKFLANAVKFNGKRARVHYSKGGYTKESGLSDDIITIYAKDYGSQLPKELSPVNDTDFMTDYFSTDIARVSPKHPLYPKVFKAFKDAEARDKKFMEKRMLKAKLRQMMRG